MWLLDGTLKNTFSELHANSVTCLMALPDNKHALSGSFDNTVKLFCVDDGNVLRTVTNAISPNPDPGPWNPNHHWNTHPLSFALMSDGRRFVTGSMHEDVRIVEHGLAPQV